MNKNNLTFALQTIPFMPYYQSNTLKYALCSSPSPLSKDRGEVLERICSKLGGGLDKAIVPVDSPVVAIEGPYVTRAGELQDMVLRNMDCVNINSEYTTIDSHFSIIDDLKTANNQETDLYFYHSDHLGSSSFITDADGIVSQHLQYLPYGELFAEQRDNTARYYTPYKFSGKEKDEETGYSYFGARYYMPELSIWSAVDPLADERSWLSPYNYCQNNPVMLTDPDGMLDEGYTVDEYGYIQKVDNTGGNEYDVLFNKSSYDAGKRDYDETGKKSGLKINDRSVLKSLSSYTTHEVATGWDAETGTITEPLNLSKYTTSKSDKQTKNEMTKLFFFLADNSNKSEWRLHKLKNGKFEIGTFHNSIESPSDDFFGRSTENIDWIIHSHPLPKSDAQEINGLSSDREAAKYYNKFWVYMPHSRTLYELYKDGNTAKRTKLK